MVRDAQQPTVKYSMGVGAGSKPALLGTDTNCGAGLERAGLEPAPTGE